MRQVLAVMALAGLTLPAAAQVVVVTVPPSGSLVTKNSVEVQGLVANECVRLPPDRRRPFKW